MAFVEKKIIKSDHHQEVESDSENDDDISGNVVKMQTKENIIEPSEDDETCNEQLPKINVNISSPPENNKLDVLNEETEAMEED